MFNILTLNSISQVIYNELPDNGYNISPDLTDPDAIIVRSADMLTREINESLLAVARAGAGTNNIPVQKMTEKGVAVFNTPGANANSVKEMVICGLLIAARNAYEAAVWTQSLKGKGGEVPPLVEKGKSGFSGHEVTGKKLGIIGIGATGAPVAEAAIALGMIVAGYDPYLSVRAALRVPPKMAFLTEDEIIKTSDYITFHTPLTDETRGKISGDYISKMKDGAVLLNFSRAELADTGAVIKALESGKLSKYVTDFPTDELLGVKNVICLPHLASTTEESEDNCAVMAASEIADFLENGNITNSVNLPECALPRSDAPRLTVIHKNVKNMLGSIGSALANAGINIENLQNSSKGDIAYTIADCDKKADKKALEAISALEGVIRVRFI